MGKIIMFFWMSVNAKNVATDVANRTELQLRQNRDRYFQGANTAERKEAALRRFDEIWEEFAGPEGCGAAALREHGKRCISERMPNGPHDWRVWYFHPIRDSVTQTVITPGEGGFKTK